VRHQPWENIYWKNWVAKHSSFSIQQLLLILFPGLTEWVILGVARQLSTLKNGEIASKTDAGYYCLEYITNRYHAIIQEAIKIRNEKNSHLISIQTSYNLQPSVRRARENSSVCQLYQRVI